MNRPLKPPRRCGCRLTLQERPGMSKKLPVQRLDTLRRDLEAHRAAGIPKTGKSTPWREIAKLYPGVPPCTLCAVFKVREPHKLAIRAALHLPVTVPVAVCSAS